MTTPQLIQRPALSRTTPEAAKAAFHSLTDLATTDSESLGALLRMNTALQTTLDISTLINLFNDELSRLVPYEGICYRHSLHEIDIVLGKVGRHGCSYNMVIEDNVLGELRLSRRRKFDASEAIQIEHAICALIYPLRNALTYLAALRAAHKDPLTGASNRGAMECNLLREVELARRHTTPLSMLMVDIDLFKSINDTYGHTVGDDVIRNLASLIAGVIRKSDMLFRFGGEEFVVLLSNTDREGALLLAERIRHGVEVASVRTERRAIPITVSLGVATLGHIDTAQTLFEMADKALYLAKGAGRNCVRTLSHVQPVECV